MEWKPSSTFLLVASSTSKGGTICPAASTSIFTWPAVSLSTRSARPRRWSWIVRLAGQVDCTLRVLVPDAGACAWTLKLNRAAAVAANRGLSIVSSLPDARGLKGSPASMIRIFALALLIGAAHGAPPGQEPDEPYVGQAGKDVIWVPTPTTLVDKMLDMAQVGPEDYVIDLGSGDGRNIIAAAKRGARALGVEWDEKLVELSRRRAAAEGVAERAKFVQGDMYEADISQASVLALFLLPVNLERLKPSFERLRPGTRIVTNGYQISGWEPKEVGVAGGDCAPWCTAYLYVVR